MESRDPECETQEQTPPAQGAREDHGLAGSYDDALPEAVQRMGRLSKQRAKIASWTRSGTSKVCGRTHGRVPRLRGRLDTLREAERELCAIDGGPVPTIESYPASEGDYGAYDPESHTISFGSSSLENGTVEEAV